jgi:hypothetical protein
MFVGDDGQRGAWAASASFEGIASGLRISESCCVATTLCRFEEHPMPTECGAESFDFGTVEGRCVEAAFDGGLVTSDAGALLLGATDRPIRMMDRFGSTNTRAPRRK